LGLQRIAILPFRMSHLMELDAHALHSLQDTAHSCSCWFSFGFTLTGNIPLFSRLFNFASPSSHIRFSLHSSLFACSVDMSRKTRQITLAVAPSPSRPTAAAASTQRLPIAALPPPVGVLQLESWTTRHVSWRRPFGGQRNDRCVSAR
jgi:hypothetical protein